MKYLPFLIAGFFIACQSTPGNTSSIVDTVTEAPGDTSLVKTMPDDTDTTSLNGSWYLIPVMASDTASGKLAQLNFDLAGKKFTGNSGCNSMSGNFEITGSSLVYNERIMLTKMACPGYNEKAFIENLLRTNSYKFEKGILILLSDNTELSRWSRSPQHLPKTNKV